MPRRTSPRAIPNASVYLGLAIAALLGAGCRSEKPAASDTATPTSATTPAASTAAKPDSGAMAGMANLAGMTGDADHDFLRMMSDHHKGLILMAHETIESKDKLGVKDIARRLDKEQDDELDKMTTMLEQDFKDPYAPKVTPDNQAMADQLKGKTGTDYDRTFLQNVIAHHEQAVKMIDDYLPKAKAPALKTMAESMKATQTKEIAEFRQKLAK